MTPEVPRKVLPRIQIGPRFALPTPTPTTSTARSCSPSPNTVRRWRPRHLPVNQLTEGRGAVRHAVGLPTWSEMGYLRLMSDQQLRVEQVGEVWVLGRPHVRPECWVVACSRRC